MAVDSAKTAGNSKNPPSKPAAKAEKRQKPPKQRRMPQAELPLLVDLAYSLPIIIILMVDFAVIGFSFAAGAGWVVTMSRAMVATVGIGGILAIISYVISTTALAATQEKLEKERKEKEARENQRTELEAQGAEDREIKA